MADTNRQRFGGLGGYSIYRVEKTNSEGVVTSAAFEVLTPEEEFLDRFKSLDQAMRLVKSLADVPADDEIFY